MNVYVEIFLFGLIGPIVVLNILLTYTLVGSLSEVLRKVREINRKVR